MLCEPLITGQQVGKILGLHPKVVERMAKRGELPALKVGKFWRYRASALVEWIRARLRISPSRTDSGVEF